MSVPKRTYGRWVRGWAFLLGVVVLVSGCANGSVAEQPAAGTIEASAYRSRDDDARGGRFQITVTNASDAAITLQTVQFRSPAFAETPPSDRPLSMGPGARLDVPVTFGTADCAASVQPIEAVVAYLDASGASTTETVPLAQPYDIIDRIHNEECAAERIAERISMTLTLEGPADSTGGVPTTGFPQRHATLTIGRVDAAQTDTIRVDEVAGSVVWNVVSDPAQPLPETLEAGSEQLRVPLLIGPATCADHVVADSKKPFVFPVWIAFGDGDPEYARIPVDDPTRSDLSEYLGNVCHGS